jgi:peroxiredoxin Q/BCP
MMPNVGEQAPDFELVNQDNQKVRLSDYRGKKVVLFAYPRADTPGCTTQACGFRDEVPRLKTSNAVVFGISADTPEDQLKWKQKYNLPYDLLCDPDHEVLEQWGAWGEKTSFGRTYDGIIRSHWVIDENGVVIDSQIGISPEDSVKRATKAIVG